MIEPCRAAGLAEPEFSVSDGFVTVIYRNPSRVVFTGEVTWVVTGEVAGEVRWLPVAIKAKGGQV